MTTNAVASTPSTRGANVRLSPPPPAVMRAVNPLVRRVLTSARLGRRIGLQGLLEFDGRRSGRRYRVPVCVHGIDGVTMVFTERPWRHNLAGGVPVTLTHRGVRRKGRARLLDATPAEVGAAMAAALANGASPFELGLRVAPGHRPTAAELSAIPRHLIRIDLDA